MQLISSSYVPLQFKTAWSDSHENKCILFISNNIDFIKTTFELIAKYTKKIDPKVQLKPCDIKQVKDFSLHSNDLTPCVDIHDILPRTVRIFYGIHEWNRRCNCHGAALMTAGINPLASFSYWSPFNTWSYVREKPEEVSLENIDVGDSVFLDSSQDHSFVFLSHELCLSMNGRGQSLEIYLTSDVLEKYGYTADALKASSSTKNITIFRKKENLDYLEEIMPFLEEYYGFYSDLMSYGDPQYHPKFPRIAAIENKLKDFMISARNNPKLNQSSKDVIDSVYYLFRNWVPCGAIPKPVEIKSEVTRVKLAGLGLITILAAYFFFNIIPLTKK